MARTLRPIGCLRDNRRSDPWGSFAKLCRHRRVWRVLKLCWERPQRDSLTVLQDKYEESHNILNQNRAGYLLVILVLSVSLSR